MSTEQPIEVEKSRLQPGGDIAAANAAVRLMTTTGVPEITNTFEEGDATYVTISILGGVIANAYQLVPATTEEQATKWPTRDGYENRFVTRGGQLHRLQGPPIRFRAGESAPPAPDRDGSHGARVTAEPAAPERPEETAHPAPPANETGGQVERTGTPAHSEEDESAAEDEDEEAAEDEEESEDAGEEKETGAAEDAKTVASASSAARATTKAAEVKKEEPPRSYEWEETPARLILHLRPNDGHQLGREIWITGVTYDGDAPKAAVVREKELGELPPPLAAVVQGLKDSLPELREAHEAGLRAEADKKRAEEERKLKEKIKSKHKSGTKAKSAATATRPASQAPQAAPALPQTEGQRTTLPQATPAPGPAAEKGTTDEAVLNDDRPVIDATGDTPTEPKPSAAATPTTPLRPQRKPTPAAESAQGSFTW